MTKPKIGIALGSGGARGWCHIGALKALAEEGVRPDVIAGCSMGALVGAAYIGGRLDALEDWALSLNWRKMAGFLDVSFSSGGLIEGKKIINFLNALREDAPIETFGIPFTAVASELTTGRETWLQRGSLLSAVRASIALPGILSPVKVDDRWLVDGGMTNPVPVSACRAMGADIIIAVNPNANVFGPRPKSERVKATASEPDVSPDILDKLFDSIPNGISLGLKAIVPGFTSSKNDTPSYIDVLSHSIDIMTTQISRSRLAGEPPHVMINPHLSQLSVLQFNRAEEAIEEGRQATLKAMPVLRDYVF